MNTKNNPRNETRNSQDHIYEEKVWFQFKNLHEQKPTEWKTALIPQHLLGKICRMMSIIFSHRFSRFFQQVLWSHSRVLSYIIQWYLGAEIEWISSLKFPPTWNFQMPNVINAYWKLCFYYLPPPTENFQHNKTFISKCT